MRVLMVSFDPRARHGRGAEAGAQAHGCDGHWTLARTDEATARKIAAVLGIQYRKLANGEFNHSTVITCWTSRAGSSAGPASSAAPIRFSSTPRNKRRAPTDRASIRCRRLRGRTV